MQVRPYLFFDGRYEEALEFYKGALGAEVQMLMRFRGRAQKRRLQIGLDVGPPPPSSSLGQSLEKPWMESSVPIENAKTRAEAQIRAVIDDWARAMRAKEVDRVIAYHAPDGVAFDLAPPLISTGADADGLQAWFSTWQGPIGYEIRDLNILASSDVAFCHSLNRLSGTKADGEEVDIWFRQTLCFRSIRGEWRIAHQHESVPFYMDGSYRAAVDLEP